jgi:RNA polymerase sigma factor (sigma-70 family)
VRQHPVTPPDHTSVPGRPDLEEIRTCWISFFDAHFHRVVRLVMHLGASLQDAQDAAQEAFTVSWALMDAGPARWAAITSKETWIRVVAVRKYKRPPGPRIGPQLTVGAAIPDRADSGPGPAELTVQTQTVLQALCGLGDEERMVMAFFLDGFSAVEIAAALDIKVQRVRDVKKKARVALKKALAGQASGGRRQAR